MKYIAVFDIPDGYAIGCAVAKIAPKGKEIYKDSDIENAYAQTEPLPEKKAEVFERFNVERGIRMTDEEMVKKLRQQHFAYVEYLEKKNKELQAEVDKLKSCKKQIEVIDRKPVPVYETKCLECRSTIRYRAKEVKWESITCPVCGVPIWVNWNLVEENQSYIATKVEVQK